MVLPSANHLRITQCILIFAISGSLWSVTPAGMRTTPTNKMVFQMGIKITNRVFNDSLLNPNSEDYKKLYDEVSQLLADVYKSPTSGTASIYEGVATMTFRNGSVIANTDIVFNTTSINGNVVKFEFLNHIEANPSASLHIDTNYTESETVRAPTSTITTPTSTITTPTTPTTTITHMTATTTNPPTTTPLATNTTMKIPTTSTLLAPNTTMKILTTSTSLAPNITATIPTTTTLLVTNTTMKIPTTSTTLALNTTINIPTNSTPLVLTTSTNISTNSTPLALTTTINIPTKFTSLAPNITATNTTRKIPTNSTPLAPATTTKIPTTPLASTTTMKFPTTSTPLAPSTITKDPSFDKTTQDPITVVTFSSTKGSGKRNNSVLPTSSPTNMSSSMTTGGSGGHYKTNTIHPPTTSHGASPSPGTVDPEKNSKRPNISPSGGLTNRPLKPSIGPQSSTTTKSSTTANAASRDNRGGFSDWVPGWAIALLVLAAVILLLLIIIFIMMVVRWCCKRSDGPYAHEKKSTPNMDSFPTYVPQAPVQEQPNGKTIETIQDDPRKKKKTGMYIVNP
ncbi:mucin-5AC-like isoform X3 [Oncorhynchus kisutch]|uniref:mucin-5AC-like isoform X3 n=1 Tax=Oncorhynchus kisutch TaxID=8019 RepID=UPI0012DE185D|nr:mucin-5AC-like isoform X3 [Oncorhynchus kisutch]